MKLVSTFVFLSFSILSVAHAETASSIITNGAFPCVKGADSYSRPKTTIYYINGIRTSSTGAQIDLTSLYSRFKTFHTSEQGEKYFYLTSDDFEYKTLYNPTDGWEGAGDIAELSEFSKIQEKATIAAQERMSNTPTPQSEYDLVYKAMLNLELNRVYNETWVKEFYEYKFIEGVDANQRLIENYQGLLTEVVGNLYSGNKTIIVAHSQGNYIAQAMNSYFQSDQNLKKIADESLRFVGAANVASTTPNNRYVTLKQDKAVYFFNETFTGGKPMPHNFDAIFSNQEEIHGKSKAQKQIDGEAHNLVKTYMGFQGSSNYPYFIDLSPKIVRRTNASETPYDVVMDYIGQSIVEAKYPEKIFQDGIITATMKWMGNDDIDLYISDPSPSGYVYWKNKAGKIGYLDVDDRDGRGPEHYYASCENLIKHFEPLLTTNESLTLDFFVTQYEARTINPELVSLALEVGSKVKVKNDIALSPSARTKKIYSLKIEVPEDKGRWYRFKYYLTEESTL